MKTIAKRIAHLRPRPCKPAVKWLGQRRNIKKAWNECRHWSWLSWLASELSYEDALELHWTDTLSANQAASWAKHGKVHAYRKHITAEMIEKAFEKAGW